MNNKDFEIGDKIYHISLPSVMWAVEKIENDLVHCTTIIKDTLELKKERFASTSIKKVDDSALPIIVSRPKRDNRW